MVYKFNKDGNVVFNVSDGLANYSQRNNQYLDVVTKKPTAMVACNVTSMGMGLVYSGYNVPLRYPKLPQIEDNLIKFCQEDPRVAAYYREKMPGMYNDWIARKRGCYPPNEVHAILSWAINLYMGCSATRFSTNVPVRDIISSIALDCLPVVGSGVFATFGHVVCIVGFTAKPEFLKKLGESKVITDDFRDLVLGWTIDDPYGNFHNGYKPVLPGNDIAMSNDEFYGMFKPLNDRYVKWAHMFNKPAAVA